MGTENLSWIPPVLLVLCLVGAIVAGYFIRRAEFARMTYLSVHTRYEWLMLDDIWFGLDGGVIHDVRPDQKDGFLDSIPYAEQDRRIEVYRDIRTHSVIKFNVRKMHM